MSATYDICFSDEDGGIIVAPLGVATTALISSLKGIIGEGEIDGQALVSGPLAELPKELFDFFCRILHTHTGVVASVPTKVEEATMEGRSVLVCPRGASALDEILRATGNGEYVGEFVIVSIGGGDAKRHRYFHHADGTYRYMESAPFAAKLGTKRINPEGLAELEGVFASGVPTLLMASIGYGVREIVRASEVSASLASPEDKPGKPDDNTRNANSLATAISSLTGANGNVWVIPRRTFGSDCLPLNMLGGLTAAVKIDAGTATWKVELRDGTLKKFEVDTAGIIAELEKAYNFVTGVIEDKAARKAL